MTTRQPGTAGHKAAAAALTLHLYVLVGCTASHGLAQLQPAPGQQAGEPHQALRGMAVQAANLQMQRIVETKCARLLDNITTCMQVSAGQGLWCLHAGASASIHLGSM
jgi:hypothetical protein